METPLRRLQSLLARDGGDVFVVINHEASGQPHTRYLSGFSGTSSYLVVPRRGKPTLFTDARYGERARKEALECRIVVIKNTAEVARVLRAYKTVVVDGETLSHAAYLRLSALAGRRIVSRVGVLQAQRIVKTSHEVASIKKAITITEQALLQVLDGVRPGMTEQEIARSFELACFEHGAEGIAFPTIVASGSNGSQPHAIPTLKKVKTGELITIDCGARVDGYHADITRTVALGRPSEKLRMLYDAVVKAQDAGFSAIRPGVAGCEVDRACREVLRERGVDQYFTHATGHGIGLEVHELPVLSAKSKTVLAEGMVVTCEPGVYIPGVGGIRIEDDLLITKRGMIQLSNGLPRTLIVL